MGMPGAALATALFSVISIGIGLTALLMLLLIYFTDSKVIDYISTIPATASIISGALTGLIYIQEGLISLDPANRGILIFAAISSIGPILVGTAIGYTLLEQ